MERPGPVEGGATITLKDLSKPYFKSDKFNSLNPHSQTAYSGDLKRVRSAIDPANTLDISRISQETIKYYLNQLNPSTANRRLATLRHFFEWAKANQLAYNDPTEEIPYFQVDNRTDQLKYLTDQEVQNLLTASKRNPRDAAFIVIALRTGANVSEIVALKKGNIRFNGRLVTIEFSQKRLPELHGDDSAIITNHIEDIPEDSYIFTRKSQNRLDHLSRQGVNLILTSYASVVGKPLSARTLRNTFIVNFEGDAKNLSKALGFRHIYQAGLMLERRERTKQLDSRKSYAPQIPEP